MRAACEAALSKVEACAKVLDAEAADGSAEWRSLQAQLLYLRGKAVSCSDDGRGSTDAERLLSDAVKLDPSLIDAWNCLGECFWQRGELETARYTFLGALEHARTGGTLCHLSMLLRTMSAAAGLNESLLFESVALAKEAVRLDPTNERAWAGLGSAHLSLHINVTGAADDLHMAHRAFTHAARVTGGGGTGGGGTATAAAESRLADLHVNHAMVCVLLDDADGALRHCTKQHAIDASAVADQLRTATWQQVVRVSEALAAKRGASASDRKFAQMLAELPSQAAAAGGGGGGGGGGGTGPGALCALAQLAPGDNRGRAIAVKVIAAIPQSGLRQAAQHHCLLVADAHESLMAMTIYEMRGVPPIGAGATLEVRDPMLVRVEASRSWEASDGDAAAPAPAPPPDADGRSVAGFHLLRVEKPHVQLRVNGHPIKPMQRAPVAGRAK